MGASKSQVEAIFINVEEILKINTVLLKSLQDTLSHWAIDSKIGDVFTEVASSKLDCIL
jgi:hypothetical protein